MSSAIEYLPSKAAYMEGKYLKRKKIVLHSTKLKEVGGLKSILTSDMEMQSLEFLYLTFSLAFVQYLLTMIPSLQFGMVMYIRYPLYIVCDLFF